MSVYTTNQTGNVMLGGGAGAGTITITGAGYPATSTASVSAAGSGGGAGQIYVSNGTSATWANPNHNTSMSGKLNLNGENADIIVNGVSMLDLLNGITDRLSILQPKPELLEKYENLREAYEHYKTLEALLHEETTTGK